MAVLLHVYFDSSAAIAVANINIAGMITVPLRLGVTEEGFVITTPRGAKLITPSSGSAYAEAVGKALIGNVSVSYTKITASVSGNFGNGKIKLLNFIASIINFALIYNTRFDILGRKEFNLRFFEGLPNVTIESRILVKTNLAGIFFALLKILFAR